MNANRILSDEWFERGDGDLLSARVIVDGHGYMATACFLSQQAAEKYLKGFLAWHRVEFRWIHDLLELLCRGIDARFGELEGACRLLNPYYIGTRYPIGRPVHYTADDAREALATAERIRQAVRDRLSLPSD